MIGCLKRVVNTSEGFKGLFDRSVGQKIQAQIWMQGDKPTLWNMRNN